MIEQRKPGEEFILRGDPVLVSKERATLPCGCAVYVGLRVDTKEVATAAIPCKSDHRVLMEQFNSDLAKSLENPTDRLLVEVVNELLESIFELQGVLP